MKEQQFAKFNQIKKKPSKKSTIQGFIFFSGNDGVLILYCLLLSMHLQNLSSNLRIPNVDKHCTYCIALHNVISDL